MEIRQAERKKAKIRLGLQGPSGSGKTFSALLMAYGMTNDWNKIVLIDTENGSADLYAHLGNFRVLNLGIPFLPERYIEAIQTCEKLPDVEVVVIDSISHEWEGSGGILDIHGNMTGNSFTNWGKVTPRHNAFIQKILQSRCHIIATIRSKQDYVLSEKNGKYVPEKVGLKGVTREGVDYELTLVLELDLKHNAVATKDRTGLFMGKPDFVVTPNTGKRILEWCNLGVTNTPKNLDAIKAEIESAEDVETLRDILRKYPEHRTEIEPHCIARKNAMYIKQSIPQPINQTEG